MMNLLKKIKEYFNLTYSPAPDPPGLPNYPQRDKYENNTEFIHAIEGWEFKRDLLQREQRIEWLDKINKSNRTAIIIKLITVAIMILIVIMLLIAVLQK